MEKCKSKIILILIVLSFLITSVWITTVPASAATLKTIPSTSVRVNYSNKLYFGYKNYTASWSGVSRKVRKGKCNYDLP